MKYPGILMPVFSKLFSMLPYLARSDNATPHLCFAMPGAVVMVLVRDAGSTAWLASMLLLVFSELFSVESNGINACIINTWLAA